MEALLVYPSSFACLKISSRGYPHRICLRQCAKLRRELGASRQKTLRIRCILVQDMVGRTPLAMIRELVAVGVAATAPPATSSLPAMALVMVTQMAMTAAAAMVCAAYLSPPLDEIWQRPRIIEDLPAATLIDGVDVTGYNIFQEPMVQEAIQYAKEAHAGQTRKTGEPYVTHCIHTARILAALVPSHGKRAVHTVVAGILHDVIDDTNRTLRDIQELFGDDVCKLVAGVSKLSYVNQVLRRHRRTTAHRRASSMNGLSSAEVDSLRVMLLGMVDDPRVVLIKLADRLHNMRTLYALPSAKACAVAQETLAVWCSLASRLGAWALKSELEDLCFAVLQPLIFRQLRTALAAMWSPDADWRHLRRVAKKTRGIDLQHDDATNTGSQVKEQQHEEDIVTTKELIETVIPFDMQSDRRTRMQRLQSVDQNLKNRTSVLQEEETILKALGICEDVLYKELVISTSYIPGTEVALSGRLKSLYSIHCKMLRKGVDLGQVYDARALRVIVGDGEGRLQAAAIEGCYFLLSIIHRLWTPINGEFDDYILNPKSSGYQSLHTAVRGPDGAPLEVQIRTKSMHEYAEYGHAAHWLYKESVNLPSASSDTVISSRKNGQINNNRVNMLEGVSNLSTDKGFFPRQLQLGHPALRVEGGRLLAAVIMRIDEGGKELLVAVSFALQAREAIAAGRSGNQRGQWVAYAKLYNKVSKKWWFSPGHGDWSSCLERYVLCSDGIYHKQDQFKRLLPTFIQPLELSNEEIEEYQEVVTMVNEGKEIYDEGIANANSKSGHQTEALTIARLNNKVKFLRSMLQWEQEVWNEASSHGRSSRLSPDHPNSVALTEVLIVRWPDGEIMRMPSGSTAADAARRMGLDGKFVYVNGQVAYPSLQLKDGDIMELRA